MDIKGVRSVLFTGTPEERSCKLAKLIPYTITDEEAKFYNLRAVFREGGFTRVEPGDYVKLIVDGKLMMSDTPMERRTNREFLENAKGDVMIAGLGIGLILHNLREKVKAGIVTSITVYEKYRDVASLVCPHYRDLPLKVLEADILTYKPRKDEKYDTIYFDIWPDINTDNLKDIKLLHNRWKNHKRPGGWMDSWVKSKLQSMRRKEKRQERMWW